MICNTQSHGGLLPLPLLTTQPLPDGERYLLCDGRSNEYGLLFHMQPQTADWIAAAISSAILCDRRRLRREETVERDPNTLELFPDLIGAP